jgi:hypothetical protein
MSIGMSMDMYELIREDPSYRLKWGGPARWYVEREMTPGSWIEVATYDESPPVRPRRFTAWLATATDLTYDLADDAVRWLLETAPDHFIDPFEEVDDVPGDEP